MDLEQALKKAVETIKLCLKEEKNSGAIATISKVSGIPYPTVANNLDGKKKSATTNIVLLKVAADVLGIPFYSLVPPGLLYGNGALGDFEKQRVRDLESRLSEVLTELTELQKKHIALLEASSRYTGNR